MKLTPNIARLLPPATLAALKARRGPAQNKYRNTPVTVGNERFDSKLEAAVYARLAAQYGAQNVIRQVSFPIGARRIRPDFMCIVDRSGDGLNYTFRLYDSKGVVTPEWKTKAAWLADKYKLKIGILKK